MKFLLAEISDVYIRQNFERLRDYFSGFALGNGKFQFVEIEVTAAGRSTYRHTLGFVPKDVIQTRLTGTGALTWEYDSFSSQQLVLTTTGPLKVRAFVGSYQEGSNA